MRSFTLALILVGCLCTARSALAQDWDTDGLDDALEDYLAHKYFPHNNMNCGEYMGWSNGSRGQFYGGDIGPGALGKVPYAAHYFNDDVSGSCPGFSCIEVRFAMFYNWDLGDDEFELTFGTPHRGDAEMIVLLVRSDLPFEDARIHFDSWYVHKIYRTAHACANGESSSFQLVNSFDIPQNWVAAGKNGNYVSSESCDDGGALYADNCDDDRCWIDRDFALSKLSNAGEFERHDISANENGCILPAPGEAPNYTPGDNYGYFDVWAGGSWGMCRHLARPISWFDNQRECAAAPPGC